MPPTVAPLPTRSEVLDDELLQALSVDPAGAMGSLYDRYARLVYGLSRALLGSPEEAEDLTQEVFLGLCGRWRYDPERGTLAAFLVTITRSRGLDKLRSRGRKRELLKQRAPEIAGEVATADPLEEASLFETARTVRRALADLPDNQRQVLELAYFSGLTQTEIANRLAMPLGTVKTWARRGLFTLREALKDVVG